MKRYDDVVRLLRRYGSFIYTGDRIADLTLMKTDLKELLDRGILSTADYAQAVNLIRNEELIVKKRVGE
ncbi:YqgQ family protein [Bacillaceae bacterium SIJ1]|uniref:YqgQ family protein n=1 Tax=Litoribacterium kuwaitense TaxID=1398745 RepID=UPI0013EA5310|nr:YqgQ family protein [Litoribacterium kuwaitense]NGP43560.1 YqgQ family protein [Litoribacterium kuwaitense]